MLITISLCMIVKDEENSLARCLDSVKAACDEIVIIDTGSSDSTKEIARRYTRRVFDFKWIHDFAAARNYAFAQATQKYILWLDADDVLSPDNLERLLQLKKTLAPSTDSVTMNYELAKDEYGNVTASLRRNRLVKRTKKFKWIGVVHEYLEVYGNIFESNVAVTHYGDDRETDRNLNIYEKLLADGKLTSPRDIYYFANELNDHGMYQRAIEFYEKFLQTGEGWIEDNLAACGKMSDCYNHLGEKEKELAFLMLK